MYSQIISLLYFSMTFLVFRLLDSSKSSLGNAWKLLSSTFVVIHIFLIIQFHLQYILSIRISNNVSFPQQQLLLSLEMHNSAFTTCLSATRDQVEHISFHTEF